MRLENCKAEGETVRIRIMGKGRKERELLLPGTLYRSIRETFNGKTWLFETQTGQPYSRAYIGKQIATLGHRILGRRISPHQFRHGWATAMIRRTQKIEAVSRYLGHSSVQITLDTYTHQTLTETELFSAMGSQVQF